MKKIYFKKSLSVFLACLMLLSCWVFVAPEHNHASASGTADAATVKSTNEAALAGVTGSTTINTTYGKYFPDDTRAASDAASLYKNVIYSGTAQSVASVGVTAIRDDDALTSFAVYYPLTVLMYDGTTTPQFGVSIRKDAQDDCRVKHGGTAMTASGLGFVNGEWYGYADGSANGKFLDSYNGGNTHCGYTYTGTMSDSSYYEGDAGTWQWFSNLIKYTGSLADNTYSTSITPSFSTYVGQRDTAVFGDNSKNVTVNLGSASIPVYVINVKPWNAAVAEGLSIYSEIANNPSKYTTESVAKYVELANALLAANPNTYNWASNTATQVTNYATNAKAAVDAWNAWHTDNTIGGLEIATYTVTFKDNDGSHDVTCAYGGSVSYTADLSPDNTYHYAFNGWYEGSANIGSAAAITVSNVIDDRTIEAQYTATAHTFEGDWVYNNDGTHSRKCTSVGADATCTVVGLNGNAYGTAGGSAACAGTWTGNGDTHSMTCTVCSGSQTHTAAWQEVADSKYQKTAQDCENDGEYYKSCSVCGLAHSTDTFKPSGQGALGHNFTTYITHVNHTCTANGYDVYQCSRCTARKNVETDDSGNLIDPAAHTWANSLSDKGDGTHGYICSVCGNEWNGVTEHVWTLADADITTAPTCTTPGEGTYRCACGITKTDTIAVDPDAHKIGDATPNDDDTHTASCLNGCGTQTVVTSCKDTDDDKNCVCDVCNDPIAHVYENNVIAENLVSAADCNSYAVYYKSCQCGDVSADTFEDTAAGYGAHNWDDTETFLKSAAECEKDAVYYYECLECGDSSEDHDGATWTKADTALVHKYTANADNTNIEKNDDGTHSYTCQNGCNTVGGTVDCNYGGYNYDSTNHNRECADCGYVETTAHTMSAWVSDDENGAAAGTQSRECTVCDYEEKNQNCNYEETNYVAPTCVTKGGRTYECTDCGHGYTTVIDEDADAHTGNNHFENGYAATCTATGYEGDIVCECGTTVDTGATLDKDPSNHGENTTSVTGDVTATCTIEGHTGKIVCDGCTETITEDVNLGIDENNHVKTTSHTQQDPTCEEIGYTAYEKCDACGDELNKSEIPATGHDYSGDAVVTDGDEHAYECKNDCGTTGVGKDKGETEACSGGTATCTALAECAVCGDTWGSLAKHVFEGEYKQAEGKEEHYRRCLSCDAYGLGTTLNTGDTEACSGGTATCLDKAECALCGSEHGAPLGHDFSVSADRVNNLNNQKHNYKCSRCDVYGTVENGTQVLNGTIDCFDAEPVRTAETCTDNAYWTHICDTCAYTWTVTEENTVLGHDYTEKLVNDAHKKSDATCTEAAVYWYDCSRCAKNAMDETDTEKYTVLTYENGSAKGHDFSGRTEYIHKATDATCTANETYYVYCTVCKVSSEGVEGKEATFVKYNTALAHDFSVEKAAAEYLASEANCTAAATYYKSCKNCGAKGTETFTSGEALGHTFTEKLMNNAHKLTDANCVTAATYWYNCANCTQNAKLLDKTGMTDEEIALLQYTDGDKNANNHTKLVDVALKLPTCTEDGYSAHKKCEGCNAEIGKTTKGYEATGHDYTGAYSFDEEADKHKRACKNGCGTYSEEVACTFSEWAQAEGEEKHSRSCVCGNTETGDCASTTSEPTCTEQAVCDTCDGLFGTTTGHDYADSWTSNGDGTHGKACENEGCDSALTEKCSGGTATCSALAVCAECNTAYGEYAAHSFGEYKETKKATCLTDAEETATCENCDATDVRTVEDSALGHNMGEFYIPEGSEPSCKDEGKQRQDCSRDGCDYYIEQVIPADKDAHVEGDWVIDTGSADCITGVKYYKYCTVCDKKLDEKTEAGEHTWKETVRVQPTCITDGYINYVCERCAFTKTEFPEELKSLGEHTWGEEIRTKEPTCGTEGRAYQICTKCNTKGDAYTIEKLSHGPIYDANGVLTNPRDVIIVEAVEPSCDEHGHNSYWKCLNCSYDEHLDPESGYVEYPALGHNDADGDGKCDDCRGQIYDGDGDSNYDDSCNCMCHNDSWLMQLIYKIFRFFWKIFGIKKTCNCGFVHY